MMEKLRKVIYLTGTRAEFGLMKNTLHEIDKKLDLKIIVTGTHLSKKYGLTIKEVIKEKFEIIKKIRIDFKENDPKFMADYIGFLIPKLTNILEIQKPDLVLVEGDRAEQLAMVIAAATMNIPIFHTSGGAISKSIDDSYRNAITKLAHIHLAPTKESANRILKMNEEKWRIHIVGAPLNLKFKKINIYKKFNLNNEKPFILVLQHPVSTEYKDSQNQIKETLNAVKFLKIPTIIIYPNSDPGSENIIKEIKKIQTQPFVKIFKNIENDVFMNLMTQASVIVGNSSAGIVESPFFKLPSIDIGLRQKNRERGDNVINVGYNKNEIIRGIKKAMSNKFLEKIHKNPYKISGEPEKNIVKILTKIKINSKLLSKEPVY